MNYKLFIIPVLVLIFISCNTEKENETANAGEQTEQEIDIPLNELKPKEVLKRYYRYINQHKYESAYALWGANGKASGRTFQEFETGYKNTQETTISFTDSVETGAAAGSVYTTVPVRIAAVTTKGEKQLFTGEYVLRKRNAGPDRESYAWHIYSAELQQVKQANGVR